MQNLKATVKGSKLTLEIDLDKELGPSGSGKTILVSKGGNPPPVFEHEGKQVRLNLTAYYKPKQS